jgi:hypothetical protein
VESASVIQQFASRGLKLWSSRDGSVQSELNTPNAHSFIANKANVMCPESVSTNRT